MESKGGAAAKPKTTPTSDAVSWKMIHPHKLTRCVIYLLLFIVRILLGGWNLRLENSREE